MPYLANLSKTGHFLGKSPWNRREKKIKIKELLSTTLGVLLQIGQYQGDIGRGYATDSTRLFKVQGANF